MLHPSYTELMKIINKDSEDDTPVINSRYSIVMATSKRARQIISGEAGATGPQTAKPLSTAVSELEDGRIRIIAEDQDAADAREISEMADRFVNDSVPNEDRVREILQERAEEAENIE